MSKVVLIFYYCQSVISLFIGKNCFEFYQMFNHLNHLFSPFWIRFRKWLILSNMWGLKEEIPKFLIHWKQSDCPLNLNYDLTDFLNILFHLIFQYLNLIFTQIWIPLCLSQILLEIQSIFNYLIISYINKSQNLINFRPVLKGLYFTQ